MKKAIVVGSGIAGMSAAYFLQKDYSVALIEKNDYIGGHTNTVYVRESEKELPIDTGFMVFNEVTYPNLIKLFRELNVDYKDTDMSFSVRDNDSGLEYNGSSFMGLFAQRKNLLSIRHWKLILEINRFNKLASELINEQSFKELSIKNFISKYRFSSDFLEHFLIPMSSAVWSTPFQQMLDFPAFTLIRFFYNHGFLGLDTQHQWKTVVEGSQQYRQKLLSSFSGEIIKSNGVKEVFKDHLVLNDGSQVDFDIIIFASHADETLDMIKNPSALQLELLSKFKYQENIALLHTDASVMPRTKENWKSWNYIISNKKECEAYTVYYMNKLQNVSQNENYFVNINGEHFVDASKVLKRIVYHHPLFDVAAIQAQSRLHELNLDHDNMYFCGSYFRYGFHEDALTSSVDLCGHILKRAVL